MSDDIEWAKRKLGKYNLYKKFEFNVCLLIKILWNLFAKQNIDTSGKLILQVGYVFSSVNCLYVILNKKDNNRQQIVDFFQFHSNNVSNKKETVRGYKRGSSSLPRDFIL